LPRIASCQCSSSVGCRRMIACAYPRCNVYIRLLAHFLLLSRRCIRVAAVYANVRRRDVLFTCRANALYCYWFFVRRLRCLFPGSFPFCIRACLPSVACSPGRLYAACVILRRRSRCRLHAWPVPAYLPTAAVSPHCYLGAWPLSLPPRLPPYRTAGRALALR